MKLNTASLSLLCLWPTFAHEAEVLSWSTLDTKLPEPLSDMTASLDTSNDLVYIAGGCNAPEGNTFVNATGSFSCLSTTDTFYSFNAFTNQFTKLPSLPRARYRHGAAFSNGRIWLLGGRTVDEAVIPEVDVFDIASNTWFTPGNLTLGVSDSAAFAIGDYVYIAGGWDQGYIAQSSAWRIKSTTVDAIEQESIASMTEARGDVKAVVDASGRAYVAGGFTDQNGYCPALATLEVYDAAKDAWSNGAPLQYPRGDKALVILDHHILAMGGERALDATCTQTNPDTGGATAIIDEVELLGHDGTWEEVESIPNARFRFDAVSVDSKVYAFGGQNGYSEDCKCYSASNEIIVFYEVITSGSGAYIMKGAIITTLLTIASAILWA